MTHYIDPKKLSRFTRGVVALQQAQETAQARTDYRQYKDDPAGFIRDVLKDDLVWEKTADVIESVRVNRKTTVKGCNAAGKDHTAAELALWWMYAVGGLVVVTGPTQKQVFEIFFGRELAPLSARAGLLKVQRYIVRGPDDQDQTSEDAIAGAKQGIIGIVSTDLSKMTGHHAPHVMCIVTEAQKTSTVAFNSIFNNATGEEDRFLVVGNPTHPAGDFYDTFRANSGWEKITITALEHPNVVQGKTVIPGGPSRVWIEDSKKREGEGSPWWLTFVLGEFPETTTDALVSPKHLTDMVARWSDTAWREQNGGALVIAIDVARFYGDFVTFCVLRGRICEVIHAWDTRDIVETEEHILDLLREMGVKKATERPWGADPGQWGEVEATIVVDSAATGGGPDVIAHIRKAGYDVIAFNGSGRVPPGGEETDRYENQRAKGYWEIRGSAQLGKIAIPDDAKLIEELSFITYMFNKAEGIQITAKKDIRKVLKRSPDRADALMMAWIHRADSVSIGGNIPTENLGF